LLFFDKYTNRFDKYTNRFQECGMPLITLTSGMKLKGPLTLSQYVAAALSCGNTLGAVINSYGNQELSQLDFAGTVPAPVVGNLMVWVLYKTTDNAGTTPGTAPITVDNGWIASPTNTIVNNTLAVFYKTATAYEATGGLVSATTSDIVFDFAYVELTGMTSTLSNYSATYNASPSLMYAANACSSASALGFIYSTAGHSTITNDGVNGHFTGTNGLTDNGWIIPPVNYTNIETYFAQNYAATTQAIGIEVSSGSIYGVLLDFLTATLSQILYSWGFGTGSLQSTLEVTPQPTTASQWSLIEACDANSVAIKTDGTLWITGANDFGQLAQGTTSATPTYSFIQEPNTSTLWTSAGAGHAHIAAIQSDGTLWTVGRNTGSNGGGQLGLGDHTDRSTLTQVAGSWATVSCAYNASSAIKTDGTLWTWGDDYASNVFSTSPVAIGTDTDWLAISVEAYNSAAIKTDGTLWTWGDNYFGQLGNGDTATNNVPTKVGTDTNWSKVDVAVNAVIALKTNGTLWAWGRNDQGQLGQGDTIAYSSPVQIGSSADWANISCGYTHTIARKTNGTIWAWGGNNNGQLGVGDIVDRSSPVQIGSAADWGVISAGSQWTMAQKA
jgi:alpha-tubulin suppressor-like RCC1 family protein